MCFVKRDRSLSFLPARYPVYGTSVCCRRISCHLLRRRGAPTSRRSFTPLRKQSALAHWSPLDRLSRSLVQTHEDHVSHELPQGRLPRRQGERGARCSSRVDCAGRGYSARYAAYRRRHLAAGRWLPGQGEPGCEVGCRVRRRVWGREGPSLLLLAAWQCSERQPGIRRCGQCAARLIVLAASPPHVVAQVSA